MSTATSFSVLPPHLGWAARRSTILPTHPVIERILNLEPIHPEVPDDVGIQEASFCLNCGNPYCEDSAIGGCPMRKPIRERHRLIRLGDLSSAAELSRNADPLNDWWTAACPAPCRMVCTTGQGFDPIGITSAEQVLWQYNHKNGLILPPTPETEVQYRVGIIGSGPAALSAAVVFRLAGCRVVVYERSDVVGGLFREGIPPFHLAKDTVKWQIDLLVQAGVVFRTNHHVGPEYYNPVQRVGDKWRIYNNGNKNGHEEFDLLIVAVGTKTPRDLPPNFPGWNLGGVHQAMAILIDHCRKYEGLERHNPIDISRKRTAVVGGGLTGADIRSFAIRSEAPGDPIHFVTATYPSDGSRSWLSPGDPSRTLVREFNEGGQTNWATVVTAFESRNGSGNVTHVITRDPVFGTREHEVDLVVLARGFLGAEYDPEGIVQALGLKCNDAGHVLADKEFRTSTPDVLAIGDCIEHEVENNPRLLVSAIGHGRDAAIFALRRWGMTSFYDPIV